MDTNVRLWYNGEITWDAPAITKSSCVVDVSYFPFDSQECNLTFGSWTYNGNQVDIIMGMDSGDLSDFVENVEWECHGMPATKNVIMYGCCSDPYPDITYTVLLQRRSSFYIFNLLLPCFLISFLAPLGFYLPADSGEKVSLGVTVLLALTVFQLMVAESMPPSESVPLIGKYYIATMTMVTASTALTIFIMNIHFCGAEAKPVPHWAKVLIIDYMSKIFFVYEVGENCASASSSSSHSALDDGRHHIHANGKHGDHGSREDRQSHKYPRHQTSKQHHPRVKVQHHITREDSSHLSSFAPGKYESSNGKIPMSEYCKEDQKVPCYLEDQKLPCCPEDKKNPPQGPTVTFGPCVFCSYGSSIPGMDTKVVRNVEYIANCFREQRATCAKGAEWKKIAKVSEIKHISEKMVKNKNPGRPLSRPYTCKTKMADSKTAGSGDLTSQDDPADSDIPVASPEPKITGQSQLGFPDRVYLVASVIFQNSHRAKPAAQRLVNYGTGRGLPLPDVKNEEAQRAAYELAFSTLKYQELLEDIMTDSCFYLTQPMPDDQMSLVAVMLCDFQDRKFLQRELQGGEIIQEVRDVENYLLRFKTKLAASLARCRIKRDLPSIEYILPDSVRKKQERSSNLPIYTWVNAQKSSLDEIQSVLKSAGFSQVQSIGQLEGQTFCQDPHCGDTLVFPAQLRAELYSTKLLSDHKLIIQDKSCSLGPNAVCCLLPDEGDVLMVGSFSGLTVSHTASLMAEKHKGKGPNRPTVYVCVSDRTDAQREELKLAVSAMGCENVKLIKQVFQSLDGDDQRLQKVRVILLTPRCSVSAVSNPIEFILQEHRDTDLLQDLSQGTIAQSKLESLVAQQRKDIDHALKFPKVVAVVYSTCSSCPEENVDVVSRALQQAEVSSDQEGEPKQGIFRPSPSPFSASEQAEATGDADPFFILEASEHSNGCFLAVLNREPERVVKEEPQKVIARANAKGILDRISSNHLNKKGPNGHTNRMKKAAHGRSSQPNLSVGVQSKNYQIKTSNSATAFCGHQGFPNTWPSSQGKPKVQQPLRSTVSSSFSNSKQENANSSSKPGINKPPKSNTPMFDTTTSLTTALHLAAPPPTPVVPVVRLRRPQQEVLKPVVLVLPTVHFPDFVPHQHRRTGFRPTFSYSNWKTTAQNPSPSCSSGGHSEDGIDKSH
ncbi:putative methyltransferase NSUN7 isoform X2 [Embiotoca jacksoni]